jgi:hypothetical protein
MLRAGCSDIGLALARFPRLPREQRLQHGCKLDAIKREAGKGLENRATK